MPTEMINPPKKAPGNSILKSLSAEKQQDIAKHAREHTLEQTREYLTSAHRITASQPTISRFLAWFDGQHEEQLNQETLAGMAEELEQRHPDWTPEKIQSMGQAYFAAYAIRQNNVRCWWQIQSLALKEKKQQLEREKFERTHIESIVRTCKNPNVRKVSQDDTKNYTQKIAEIGQIMFEDEDEPKEKAPTPNLQAPEKHQTANENVESLNGGTVEAAKKGEEGANTQHSTFNTQHPIEEGKGGKGEEEKGSEETPISKLHAPENGEKAPSTKLQAPEKHQTSKENVESLNGGTVESAKEQNAQSQEKRGKGEEEKGSAESTPHPDPMASQACHEMDAPNSAPALRSVIPCRGGEGGDGSAPSDSQPSTNELQPSEKGSMTEREADHAIQAWRSKAKALGVWQPPSKDDAALKAYLTNQNWKRYNPNTRSSETLPPPERDPRHDPASNWCSVWKHMQVAENQYEKN